MMIHWTEATQTVHLLMGDLLDMPSIGCAQPPHLLI